jgi:hypothetical protein
MTLQLLPVLDRQADQHHDRSRPVISIVGSETAAWAECPAFINLYIESIRLALLIY